MTGIPARQVAVAKIDYDAVQVLHEGRLVYWVEGRPDGRDVLVRWTPEHGVRDVLSSGRSVASRVHEYGGGAYLATESDVWFCDAADQRLYHVTGDCAVPVTPAPSSPGAIRYADMRVSPDRHGLWSVRERHEGGHVVNELVWIPLDAAAEPVVVADGWDFYSFPRPSPDGRSLAWTCWNAPLMPWDGAWLYVADVLDDGRLGEPTRVAGGTEESVFQPEWSPCGVLHFVSDRCGWWNLYRWCEKRIESVLRGQTELGAAQWEFGYSTYTFLGEDRIAVLAQHGGRRTLELVHGKEKVVLDLPYTSIKPYLSGTGSVMTLIASDPNRVPEVVLIDADTGSHRCLACPEVIADIEPYVLSQPRPFDFATRDGDRAYGLYHWPARGGDPPPLIIKAHPGPTSDTPLRLDQHTRYFTSRGYAVAEIDYRGSTGYGRAYRQALRGRWGVLDAYDCADAAAYLATTGHADPGRTVIWGASAGGYTALRALALTDIFAAAIACCPVIDPATWREAAPKFQAHHADGLIGPWPESAAVYRERSILGCPDSITRPLLLLHGGADPVTPPEHSRALAEALGRQARLIIFPGEGHVLKSPESIIQALEAQSAFLSDL